MLFALREWLSIWASVWDSRIIFAQKPLINIQRRYRSILVIYIHYLCLRALNALVRLCICEESPEHLLLAVAISTEIPCTGPYVKISLIILTCSWCCTQTPIRPKVSYYSPRCNNVLVCEYLYEKAEQQKESNTCPHVHNDWRTPLHKKTNSYWDIIQNEELSLCDIYKNVSL